MTPAELKIYEAMQAVEALPPDERLTEAVVLLGKARDRVADYVDDVVGAPLQSDSSAALQAFKSEVMYELGAERNPDLAVNALKVMRYELEKWRTWSMKMLGESPPHDDETRRRRIDGLLETWASNCKDEIKQREETEQELSHLQQELVKHTNASSIQEAFDALKRPFSSGWTLDSFGWAVEQLKSGKKVQRAGWNGKGMWLMLIPAKEWSTSVGPSRVEGATPHRLPWIAMKTADNGLVPWLASQTDMLAEDWSVVS